MAVATVLLVSVASCTENVREPADGGPADAPTAAILGAKVKVTDMDEAIAFYSGILGYEIASRERYPDWVSLRDEGMLLVLERVTRIRQTRYPGETQTILVFQANDLDATIAEWRARGVRFYYDTPQRVGVGRSTKFHDPFGNIHSLLEETVVEVPRFREPRIYNIGYYVPEIEPGRRFYSVLLGMPIRTLSYYPPALPLNDTEGNFSTILHVNGQARAVEVPYPDETVTLAMFGTEDLDALLDTIRAAEAGGSGSGGRTGGRLITPEPLESPLGRYLALRDPYGNVLEIYERAEER